MKLPYATPKPPREIRMEYSKRMFNRKVVLLLPREVVKNKLIDYKAMRVIQTNGKEDWKPKARSYMMNCKPEDIVAQFNKKIRGFYNYYSIANNLSILCKRFGYIMEYSMYKSIAKKQSSSIRKIKKKDSKEKDFVISYTDAKGQSKCRVFYNEGFKRKDAQCDAKCDIIPNTNFLPASSLVERLKVE